MPGRFKPFHPLISHKHEKLAGKALIKISNLAERTAARTCWELGTLRSKTGTSTKTSFNIATLCFLFSVSWLFQFVQLSQTIPTFRELNWEEQKQTNKEIKSKICACALASSLEHKVWSFHVADWQRMGKKCTNYKAHLQSHCFAHSCLLFGGVLAEVAVLKHARFWDADGNRKWAVFPFNLPSHNHIHIAKYRFSIREDEYKNLGDTTVLARETFSSRCRTRLKNVRASFRNDDGYDNGNPTGQ